MPGNMIVRIKIHRKDCPYVLVDRRALLDSGLSWRAKGLLCYCLALPDKARVTVSALVEAGPDGEQCVQTGLHELSEHGYASLEPARNKKGRVMGKQWNIYEVPELCK